MAIKKVKAPVGHHFMRNKEGDFYLMENPPTGYRRHFDGPYNSSLTIDVEVHQKVISPTSKIRSRTTPVSSTPSAPIAKSTRTKGY
jgi:hypothetical protein